MDLSYIKAAQQAAGKGPPLILWIIQDNRGGNTRWDILVFLQAMQGMAVTHQNKIIYWDLKPQNFFVFPEDLIKNGDFEFGKRLQSD